MALAAFGAVGLFVLRPAGRTIAAQIAALRDARDRLEDRVADRTRDLKHANAALHREHRDRLRAEEKQRELPREYARVGRVHSIDQTASGLAHELNQPLGAAANDVEGCLARLERGAATKPNRLEDLAEAMRKARDAALRAGTIVARVRRIAERGPAEFVPLDPAALVREVAELMEDQARRRGVRLDLQCGPPDPLDGRVEAARSSEPARHVCVSRVVGDRVQL